MKLFARRGIILAAIVGSLAAAAFEAKSGNEDLADRLLQIDQVTSQGGNLYRVRSGSKSFLAVAPDASVLPDLQNEDSLSEDWFCVFTTHEKQTPMTFRECKPGPQDFRDLTLRNP